MDFMIIPDLERNNHTILIINDIASDFTVAVYACSGSRPNAAAARRSFELGWLLWAGPPTRGILQGMDSAFMATFETLANDLGLNIVPAAPEAHWQMGRIERKVQFLKRMSTTVFDVHQVVGEDAVAVACREMANACNALVSNAGLARSSGCSASGRGYR